MKTPVAAFLCFFLLSLEGSDGTLSGFYADNGVDQTVLQRVISQQEKRAVQDEILHLLGLPEKPRVLKKRSSASAPQFLLDVYKSMLDNPSSRSTRSEFSLSEQERDAIQESDKIISFASRSHHVANVRHEKGKRLWFDVSEVGPGESIVGSELRLYQSPVYPLPPEQKYTVTLYRVLHSRLNGEEGLEFVESLNTTNDREGWLIFNTTGSLALWVAFPNLNKGFYLSIQAFGSSGHEYLPETIGLTTKPGDKQPFMVAFLRGDEHRSQVRVRRQARHRKKKSDHGESSYLKNPFSSPQDGWPQSHRSCKIQNLFVSFEDLEWEDWIIAPKGYSADYCSGECNFPLNAHMNATNHAIVQTLVHLMNPLQVPKPCCAPTRLKPISVLYFVDDYNVMIKKYNNMVVKSCGCH